jgi:hypothetical protein
MNRGPPRGGTTGIRDELCVIGPEVGNAPYHDVICAPAGATMTFTPRQPLGAPATRVPNPIWIDNNLYVFGGHSDPANGVGRMSEYLGLLP